MHSSRDFWAELPRELLGYATGFLTKGFDGDLRLAILVTDIAGRVAISNFLQLPSFAGKRPFKDKDVQGAARHFPALMEMLRKNFPDKLNQEEAELLAYLHRIRNAVVYQGYPISVRRRDAHMYTVLVERLVDRLLGPRSVCMPNSLLGAHVSSGPRLIRDTTLGFPRGSDGKQTVQRSLRILERVVTEYAMSEGFAGTDFVRACQYLSARSLLAENAKSILANAVNMATRLCCAEGNPSMTDVNACVAEICQATEAFLPSNNWTFELQHAS